MMVVGEAFAGWLIGRLADASRRGLIAQFAGTEQERALRKAATAGIQAAALELRPRAALPDDQGPEQLARVIDQVFQQPPTPAEALTGRTTLLHGLQDRVAGRLAVLGNDQITGTGHSSAELLGVQVPAVVDALTRHLVREILVAGAGGGPLTPLADQLNHDLTHLQGQQQTAMLRQLAEDLRGVRAALDRRHQHLHASQLEAPAPVGRPIEELTDPFALEVHRAITIPATTSLPALPVYVERDHDRQLQAIVAQAANGHSAVVVLVGGSSTGKTRVCWEAVQRLPVGWRVWHPIDPGRPEAAATAIGAVGPQTVVWLNGAHHYLFTPASGLGEQIAAGLRELLRDPTRRPVLVLGTIWPDYWATLTTPPDPRQWDDPHAQARALLTGADLPVPDAFTGAALQGLQVAAKADPRLAEAAAQAQDGRITQFLAGVPALLERYCNAPAGARALIEAAMDARRLGHARYLPLALVAAAAPEYLTDHEWTHWTTAGWTRRWPTAPPRAGERRGRSPGFAPAPASPTQPSRGFAWRTSLSSWAGPAAPPSWFPLPSGMGWCSRATSGTFARSPGKPKHGACAGTPCCSTSAPPTPALFRRCGRQPGYCDGPTG